MIATAHIDKALSWPSIKADDAEALQAYSVFLTGCSKMMDSTEYMEEMDNPTTMRADLSKLPYKLKEKWRGLAYDLQEKNGRRATFTDLVDFTDHQARIISHPLFGNLKETDFRYVNTRTGTSSLSSKYPEGEEEWFHYQCLTCAKGG